jgi:hypothetical protein
MRRRRDAAPELFSLRCQQCGEYLVRTSERYLTCPNGHGRLHEAEDCRAEEARREDTLFDSRLDAAGW